MRPSVTIVHSVPHSDHPIHAVNACDSMYVMLRWCRSNRAVPVDMRSHLHVCFHHARHDVDRCGGGVVVDDVVVLVADTVVACHRVHVSIVPQASARVVCCCPPHHDHAHAVWVMCTHDVRGWGRAREMYIVMVV